MAKKPIVNEIHLAVPCGEQGKTNTLNDDHWCN